MMAANLRGNQLASALQKAGVVPPNEADPPTERELLDMTRDVLFHVATHGRFIDKPRGAGVDIIRRLGARGILHVAPMDKGRFDMRATPALLALARTDITDAKLREIALTDVADEPVQREETMPEEVFEEERRTTRMPKTRAARDAWILQRALAWLKAGADGSPILVKDMLDGEPIAYGRAHKMREAGLIERTGEGVNQRYRVCDSARETVLDMTEADLGQVLADRRRAAVVEWEPSPEPLDEQAMNEAHELALNGQTEPAPAPGESVPVEVLGQIAAVLERLDARLARLEKELGLPPLVMP